MGESNCQNTVRRRAQDNNGEVVVEDPSGDDEHVERLLETVPVGVRERGVSYPFETVPQVLGSNSLRLAQSDPNRKRSRAFRRSAEAQKERPNPDRQVKL